ncbi:MAG TPA: type IV pilus biogenesis/stability protein PilW [Thiolapillus brandeum]|uniref:Type IV pilus biogenesis/stability protein PilW n=1 Tax=Thiolapillus brandeum TaxID=1076588 RepID=A0A831KB44_9GAMM|nr:type IV pilus biogenesis/stability protein PilW [Thiolapillus brandeum]
MKQLLLTLLLPAFLAGCGTVMVQGEAGSNTGNLGKKQAYDSASDNYIKLAYEYLRRGDQSTALIRAKKAVAHDRGNANAHLVLALVYESLGENGPANAAYRRSMELDGKNPYTLNAYGTYLCKLGEYQRALPLFDKALQNPLYETPWVALANAGFCARKAGEVDKAENYLMDALERNPGYSTALLQMAELRYEKGNYMSARAYLQRYRELAKPSAQVLYLSILTERELGDHDQLRSDELLLKSEFPDSEQARKLGY